MVMKKTVVIGPFRARWLETNRFCDLYDQNQKMPGNDATRRHVLSFRPETEEKDETEEKVMLCYPMRHSKILG